MEWSDLYGANWLRLWSKLTFGWSEMTKGKMVMGQNDQIPLPSLWMHARLEVTLLWYRPLLIGFKFQLVSFRTSWFTRQKQWGLHQNKVTSMFLFCVTNKQVIRIIIETFNRINIPSIVTGDCTRSSFTIPFLGKGSGTNIKRIAIPGEQGWRNGESTCLPLLWPGFDSRTRRHMWVEFVVGSCPSSEGFSPGSLVFLPPQKSALLNSNSIWKQWMKSHLMEMPLQIPLLLLFHYYYYRIK